MKELFKAENGRMSAMPPEAHLLQPFNRRAAGSLANDLNNLFIIIQGYSEISLMDSESSKRQRRYAREIQKAAERATLLTRQLLASAKSQKSKPPILPADDRGEARGKSSQGSGKDSGQLAASILLVEDEAPVRRVVRQMLERSGFFVLEASSSREAVHLCHSYQNTIHLLVTDVVMPQVGGRELAQILCPLRPEMKMLFISGFPEGNLDLGKAGSREASFLQKPFTSESLSQKVRELLGGTDPQH